MADYRRKTVTKIDKSPRPDDDEKEGRINCFHCRYFFITYDPSFPYGCRAAGFRSRVLPAEEVFISSGMHCLLYIKKEKTR